MNLQELKKEKQEVINAKNKMEHTEFLETLRESGVTNMFGAAGYIEREFGVSKREAREILTSWMRNFS